MRTRLDPKARLEFRCRVHNVRLETEGPLLVADADSRLCVIDFADAFCPENPDGEVDCAQAWETWVVE